MSPRVIVTDLDRTLTGADLLLDGDALDCIDRLRLQGIKLVVATGRRIDDIPRSLIDRVDGVVAENGAIVIVPAAGTVETKHAGFADSARAALGPIGPRLAWGRVVGSGPRELAPKVSMRMRAAQIPSTIEFNAEEMMLLPKGIDKASGAATCLERLGLTAKDAWAIGDGENDASMLRWAHVGIAPANATASAKAAASVHVASAYSRAFVEMSIPLLPGSG